MANRLRLMVNILIKSQYLMGNVTYYISPDTWCIHRVLDQLWISWNKGWQEKLFSDANNLSNLTLLEQMFLYLPTMCHFHSFLVLFCYLILRPLKQYSSVNCWPCSDIIPGQCGLVSGFPPIPCCMSWRDHDNSHRGLERVRVRVRCSLMTCCQWGWLSYYD